MVLCRTSWYVFRVQPQFEEHVKDELGWRAIDALAPRTRTFERISRRRRIERDAPAYPGYVFACVFGPLWPRLQRLPKLHPQPIAMDGVPYRLTVDELAMVRHLQAHPLTDPRAPVAPHVYQAGELVRILQGPFAKFEATVDADKGRKVQVTTRVFGRPTPVTVPRHWVEAA